MFPMMSCWVHFSITLILMSLKLCRHASNNRLLEQENDIIISLFTRFNSMSIPISANLEQLTKNVAKYVLLSQPYFALNKIRSGMLASRPSLWQQSNSMVAISLLTALVPSATQAWAMVEEPQFNSTVEIRIFDYFSSFRLFLVSGIIM